MSGCGKRAVECSSSDATSITTDLLKTSLEKAVYDKTRSASANADVSRSSIRAAIAQLGIMIEDIRTSREDPNGTKPFCEGSLKIDFPADLLDRAERARSAAGLGNVIQLADSNDIDREANSFSDKIQYDVQPTDEGDKVFAESNTGSPILSLASDIVGRLSWKPQFSRLPSRRNRRNKRRGQVHAAGLLQGRKAAWANVRFRPIADINGSATFTLTAAGKRPDFALETLTPFCRWLLQP